VTWLLGDHLGSTSLSVSESGTTIAEAKYTPLSPKGMLREGKQRELAGDLPTDYAYTGQREESALGLMYYVARWYDSGIGHFVQADTVVPGAGNPAAWNRYAYVMYNPVKYVDPSGHTPMWCAEDPGLPGCEWEEEDGGGGDDGGPEDDLPESYDMVNGWFNIATIMLDTGELIVSMIGAGVELSLALIGEAVTPVPGADGAVGGAAGVALYSTVLNPIEDIFGWLGLMVEFGQGIYNGENYIDETTGEIVIGQDTTTELLFNVAGQLTPEATVDSVINFTSLVYDIASMGDAFHGPISLSVDYFGGITINWNNNPLITIPSENPLLRDP
jgi:RHS repeat-associated protein